MDQTSTEYLLHAKSREIAPAPKKFNLMREDKCRKKKNAFHHDTFSEIK